MPSLLRTAGESASAEVSKARREAMEARLSADATLRRAQNLELEVERVLESTSRGNAERYVECERTSPCIRVRIFAFFYSAYWFTPQDRPSGFHSPRLPSSG